MSTNIDNIIIYQNGFGYADKENDIIIDGNTVYDWGSISKLFIWISVMQLVEQGKLDLGEDIRNCLPEGFLKNLTYDTEITMLDLMNHQAGFQETYFIQTANADEMVSLEDALSRHQTKQVFKPGEVTSYSNWGAALAAYIVQNISGTDYVEYVHENIFEPLGMEHTSIGATYQDNAWVKQQREDLSSWWYQDSNHVYTGYSDYIISTPQCIMSLLCCMLFIAAGVYGAVTLIFGGLIYSPVQRRLYRKKGVEITHTFRKWNYSICSMMSLILIDIVVMFIRMNIGNITGNIGHIESYMVQSAIIGLLAVALIICLVWGLIYWRKKHITDTKKEKAKYITTVTLAVCMLTVIVLFDMYQFWAM